MKSCLKRTMLCLLVPSALLCAGCGAKAPDAAQTTTQSREAGEQAAAAQQKRMQGKMQTQGH